VATLINPTPGATLGGSSQTFSWTPLAGATGYALWLGTTAGSGNLLNAHTTATSATATNLPVNGATIYARLYTNFNGVTGYIDMGLPPWLRQTVKTHIAVRCKMLDRQDHCTAF
jgi:hypothetical protein